MSSVLIVVFDGLQPAQVTPELMPNLAAVAAEGVAFGNHHSVFPTVTRANAASMVTGRYPGGHGLAANTLVVREFDPGRAIPVLEPELTRLVGQTGRALLAPGLADLLGAQGKEYVAVGVGSSGNAFLHNPHAESSGGATVHPDFCLPRGLHAELISRFGPWPEAGSPNVERLAHAARIMTEYVLPVRDPAVSLLWSSEPDGSQHAAGVGSDLARRALEAADRQFGKLLGWLDETGRAAETDVIVLSDHGYSTSTDIVEIEALVRGAGFPQGGQPGGVIVAENGGSALFYAHGGDRAIADRLAAWLMAQPWCGPVVASEAANGIPGTLPAAVVGAEGPRAPDLAMSFSWDSTPNARGFVGHAYNTSKGPGLGIHGSMSRHEIRCVLIARGPSFKLGMGLQTPSGQVDLAPTVLAILGLEGGAAMDGRVLREALRNGPSARSVDWSTRVHEAERVLGEGAYGQRITTSRVGDTVYVDEGHSSFEHRSTSSVGSPGPLP